MPVGLNRSFRIHGRQTLFLTLKKDADVCLRRLCLLDMELLIACDIPEDFTQMVIIVINGMGSKYGPKLNPRLGGATITTRHSMTFVALVAQLIVTTCSQSLKNPNR